MKLTPRTFWFALNQTGWNPLVDALTGSNLTIPRANTTRFLFSFFNGNISRADNFADDISNVASCTLVLRKSDENGAILYVRTLPAADFNNPGCSYAAWSSQTDWQVGFELSKLETNWAPQLDWDEKIWIAVEVMLADGSEVTLGHGTLQLVDPGIDTTDPVTQNIDLKASTAEAEAGTDDAKWMTPLKTAQAVGAFLESHDVSLDGSGNLGVNTLGIQGKFFTLDESGNLLFNGSPIGGGSSYDQSLNTTDSPTFAGQTINGTSSLDSGAITTNGAGNLRFLAGIDQYENPYYTTLNAGELQFGFNAYGDPCYAGVSPTHVYLTDQIYPGSAGASFTSSYISGSTTGNGDTWHLGDAGLLINPSSNFAVASISGTNGSVLFDGQAGGGAGTPITSDGNGNLNAASLGVAGTYLTNDSGNLLWNGSPIRGNQFNQSLNTTDSPAFNGLTLNSDSAQSYLGAAGLGASIFSGAFNYAISPGGVSGYNPSVACWGLGASGLSLTAGWADGTQPTFASISGTDGSVVFDGLATNPIISDGNGNLRVNTLTTTAVLTYNDLYNNSNPTLGARALCSESNTKVLGAQITTRGSYVVPIYGDGSVWRVG